jgi:hypothetical protein
LFTGDVSTGFTIYSYLHSDHPWNRKILVVVYRWLLFSGDHFPEVVFTTGLTVHKKQLQRDSIYESCENYIIAHFL